VKKELILDSGPQETRAALLEDGHLAELFIERCDRASLLGNLYLGKVSNVLPGMQSAFVDIGLDRDAFLYVTDLFPGSRFDDKSVIADDPPPGIESVLQAGQDLLVQVVKEPLGGKGPRVTTQVSLPGRSLVYLPEGTERLVSRRIEPAEERDRLKLLAEAITGEGGFIVRTAAMGSNAGALQQEAEALRRSWSRIRSNRESATAPACLHSEECLAVRILRDLFTEEIERVLVDDEPTLARCRDYAQTMAPLLLPRLARHDGNGSAFDVLGIEKEIQKALRRRVWLPSGGYLVIQPTEALVAIDVNTGKFVGSKGFEETALVTNLEAAREVVRQIRLRDLGGILVIDFIDMPAPENRRKVFETLEQALRSDRARSRVLQISEFGLVEITRQRIRLGLENFLCAPCATCRGTGRLKNPETMRFEIQRELRKVAALSPEGPLRVRVSPEVAGVIRDNWAAFLEARGTPGRQEVLLESVPGMHPEEYEVLAS
jgi:ribonuclease G